MERFGGGGVARGFLGGRDGGKGTPMARWHVRWYFLIL